MVLLLSPFAVFANNNDIGVHYTSWNIDDYTIDGFGVDYSGLAGDNNFLIDFTYDNVDDVGGSVNYNILSLAYAFGNANEGAFSLGMARFDAEGSSESEVMIGYGRRGGEGVDYHIGLIDGEEDATFSVKIRGERGVTFSVLASDGDTLSTIGYSWRLDQ